MLSKPTQDERDANFQQLREALKDYYKLLARDFNHASDAEDEDFLDSEMKRTWDFLWVLDFDSTVELRAWLGSPEGSVVDAEYMDYMAENDENGPRYGKD